MPPHPFFLTAWALSAGLTLGLLGLWAGWRRRRGEDGQPADVPSSAMGFALALMGALAAGCAYRSVASLGVWTLVGGDEYCRADYALQWAQDPFFAPHDHIWLAGQFYILGTLFKFLGNMPLATSLSGLIGLGALIFFSADAARRAWGDPAAGFFAGSLAASHKVILWGSFNTFAEVFALPALMAGLDFWLAGWLARRKPPSATGEAAGALPSFKPELWFLAAAASLGFGTMFRYELWFAGIALGAFLGFRALWILAQGPRRTRAIPLLTGCALLAAYPVGWMISSWLVLGSPLQFLRDASRMNIEGNRLGFYDFSNPLLTFLTYPKVLWLDHWPWLVLPIAGLALALARGRRGGAMPLAAAWAVLLLVSMLATAKSGIGSNYRPRYTTFFVLPLLCLGAGPLAMAWGWLHGKRGAALRIAMVLLVAWLGLGSANIARIEYPNGWGMSGAMVALATRLSLENEHHREGQDVLWPSGSFLIYHFGGAPERYWMLRYHCGRAGEMGVSWNNDHLAALLREAAPGTRFLIMKPLPPIDFPARARRLQDASPAELWVIEEPTPPQSETTP